jgi:hypothetical protein
MNQKTVFQLVSLERERQKRLWGGDHEWGNGDCSTNGIADTVKLAVLTEEAGEVARAVLQNDPGNLKTELIQVAAVAVAWLESIPPRTETP